MNGRAVGLELAALVAWTIAVYAGTVLFVAGFGDGESASLGAVVSVVVLSYALARGLRQLDMRERVVRLSGVGLTVPLICLIMRVEIAGDPYLWQIGWVRGLLTDPEAVFAGHAGHVVEFMLLSAAWLLGVARGARPLSFEQLLAESSAGLILVFLAGAFVSAVDEPRAVRWLAVPYMCATLLAFALAHARPVDIDDHRPFRAGWAAWTGGSLVAIAAAAALANAFAPEPLTELGGVLVVAAQALALAAAVALSPLMLAAAFIAGLVVHLLPHGQPPLPLPDVRHAKPQHEYGQTAVWVQVLGYVLFSCLAALVAVGALVALWFAFRRFVRQTKEDEEVREEVAGSAASLRDLLAGTISRLRWRPGHVTRDAIGRLYVTMLHTAAAEGVVRPPASTPLEFAGNLQAHFDSNAPLAISAAYARARYAARPPTESEVRRLRLEWRDLARGR